MYNPERLQIVDECKTVTGIIEESSADEDGDQPMLLKLDNGQEDLCQKKYKEKTRRPCGYINKIQIPKLGDHVRVTGSLVIDTHNGWSEIQSHYKN